MNTHNDARYERARETLLQLHGKLAEFFLDLLQKDEANIKASHLTEARGFLRDNGIDIDSISRLQQVARLQLVQNGEKPALGLPFPVDK